MIPEPPEPPPARIVRDGWGHNHEKENPVAMPSVGRGWPAANEETLTGKRRYRVGWGKKLVLQVEVAYCDYSSPYRLFTKRGLKHKWRDATINDISEEFV